MKKMLPASAALAIFAATGAVSAQTLDGSSVGDPYGLPLFIQDTRTGFGDNTDPSAITANGSEIDGVYANISDGNLNLLVTGNLETNFNRLVFFFDTSTGGDNVVGTTATDTSTGGGTLNSYNGLTFDDSFDADSFLSINGGGTPVNFFADFATIGGTGAFIGQTDGDAQSATFNNGIGFAFDNSNIAGVPGDIAGGDFNATAAEQAAAAAVLTGFEFQIPLSVLGNPTGTIDIAGFISGGGDFLSNQVIGGVNGAGNLGAASGVDFGTIDGSQFVTVVVPEPASLALLGLGGLTLLRRRGR